MKNPVALTKAALVAFATFLVFPQGIPFVAAAGLASLPNPSLETPSAADPTVPDQWHKGSWGTNQTTFQYPVPGDASASAASITMTQYSSGDAKWYFDDVAVTPGDIYTFSDNYQSTVPTNVTIQYTMTNGSLSYVWIASPPASASAWAQTQATFTIPANASTMTIFHTLSAVGTLTVDNYSLTKSTPPPPPPPPPTTGNLIPNAALTSPSPTDPTSPAYWHKGGWGTNVTTYTYPATGESGNSAVSLAISSYTNGDAKWYFDDVNVTPGDTFQFSDRYQSNVPTAVAIQYRMTNGAYTYADLGSPAASPSSWTQTQSTFTVPANVSSLTIFHVLNRVGTLTINQPSLTKMTAPPPPPPPTSNNLIVNAALTSPSPTDPSQPANWHHGGWGSSRTTYSYPVTGANGSAGVGVAVASYANGDAKWYFDPVTVTPGENYQFTDTYQSTIPSTITVQFTLTNGLVSYQDIAFPTASTAWKQETVDFSIPLNAVKATVFHLIQGNGSLVVSLPGLKQLPTQALSQAMITFSFDDGFQTVYDFARPMLDAANIKPTLYLVSGFLDTPDYMTTQEALELNRNGYEIGGHTRTHAHLTQITPTQLTDEVLGGKQDLQALGLGPITTFAYPFGEYNDAVIQAVKDAGFVGARSVNSGFNDKSADQYLLMDQHVESNVTAAQIETWIDQAIAQKKWLILELHDQNPAGDQWSNDPAVLQAVINYVQAHNVRTVTVAQGLQILNQP